MPPKQKVTSQTRVGTAILRPDPNTAPKVDARRVAAVAYRLFEERGRQHGHDLEDWVRAEQIVKAEQIVRNQASR